MRMIIEARIDDAVGGGEAIRLAEFERLEGDLKQLGLNLAEGRRLLHEAQRALVCAQTRVVVSASLNCPQCGRTLSIKATHAIRYKTVFGKVTIDSPQVHVCKCAQDQSAKSFSPLALAMPLRVSPELEYLQVKWAAHLPYAVATTLLKEVLPVDKAISASGLRNRVLTVGQELDDAPKARFAVNETIRRPIATSTYPLLRWILHGCATGLLVKNRMKPSSGSISLQSAHRLPGDT